MLTEVEASVPAPQWIEHNEELEKEFEDFWAQHGEELVLQKWTERYGEYMETEATYFDQEQKKNKESHQSELGTWEEDKLGNFGGNLMASETTDNSKTEVKTGDESKTDKSLVPIPHTTSLASGYSPNINTIDNWGATVSIETVAKNKKLLEKPVNMSVSVKEKSESSTDKPSGWGDAPAITATAAACKSSWGETSVSNGSWGHLNDAKETNNKDGYPCALNIVQNTNQYSTTNDKGTNNMVTDEEQWNLLWQEMWHAIKRVQHKEFMNKRIKSKNMSDEKSKQDIAPAQDNTCSSIEEAVVAGTNSLEEKLNKESIGSNKVHHLSLTDNLNHVVQISTTHSEKCIAEEQDVNVENMKKGMEVETALLNPQADNAQISQFKRKNTGVGLLVETLKQKSPCRGGIEIITNEQDDYVEALNNEELLSAPLACENDEGPEEKAAVVVRGSCDGEDFDSDGKHYYFH